MNMYTSPILLWIVLISFHIIGFYIYFSIQDCSTQNVTLWSHHLQIYTTKYLHWGPYSMLRDTTLLLKIINQNKIAFLTNCPLQ